MHWSFTLGHIFGIPIRVHFTFVLLLLFVAAGLLGVGSGGFYGVMLVVAAFACVVAHELAHSLMARRVGIRVRAITLLPFGGVAQMERLPDNPRDEIAIAVVGPLTSLALSAVFYWVLRHSSLGRFPLDYLLQRGNLLAYLTVINLMLGIFNVIPAFPMDGGRVLRGLLALRMPFARATRIAVNVGQFLAVIMFVYGIFANMPMLALIALFIYLGAEGEERISLMNDAMASAPVSRAMISPVVSVEPDEAVESLLDRMCHTCQTVFPVVDTGRLVGMLPGDAILRAAERGGFRRRAREIMKRDFPVADPFDDMQEVFDEMTVRRLPAMPVARGGSLIGLISPEQILRYDRICALTENRV